MLAMAAGFIVFPIWSLSFANPIELYIRTGSISSLLTYLLPYWIGPLAVVFFALRRSLFVLPVFLLECCALFAQTMMTPIAASPYLQVSRFVILFAFVGIGFLLVSREMVFPLLSKGNRRWRANARFYLNQRARLESISSSDVKAKAMIENTSRSGILISVASDDVENFIDLLKPNVALSLTALLGNESLLIEGSLAWYETVGPLVRLGIESSHPIPVERFVRRKAGTGMSWASVGDQLRLLGSSRLLSISLWSIVIGATLAIPNCGREDDSGVARVGDAPENGALKIKLVWDRNGQGNNLQLAGSQYQIVSTVEGCKSGYYARIDWTEDEDSLLPIPEGDVDCVIKISEIRLATEIFVPQGPTYKTELDAINTFASALGNVLEVQNTRILPVVVSGDVSIAFSIATISRLEPIVLKVELPQNACEIQLARENKSPFSGKRVQFIVRVHPAYLNYASLLTFFPCGDSQQWGRCRPRTRKTVKFANKFSKRLEKKQGPYVVTATLDLTNPAIRMQAQREGKSLSCSEFFYLPK